MTNIDSKKWDPIVWEEGKVLEGLRLLRARADLQALDAIEWYYQKKKSKNRWSRWLRFWTISFSLLGGLVPILAATGIVERLFPQTDAVKQHLADLRFNQFGYIFIGPSCGMSGLQ